MKLEIDNYYELLALHKMIMAVKFDKNKCLKEAQGSPYSASLVFKVFEMLVEHSISNGRDADADHWLRWQEADEERLETQLLISAIKESDWWSEAETSTKEKFIKDFMAPLKLSNESISRMVSIC